MKRCEQLQEDSQKDAAMGMQNERLRYGAGVMAEQYAELYESFVDLEQSAENEGQRSDRDRQRLEAELQESRQTNRDILEERDGLAHQLYLAQRHVDILKEALNAALASRRELQSTKQITSVLDDLVRPLDPVITTDEAHTILDLSLNHSSLCQAALVDAREHIITLTINIIELESSVRKADDTLRTVQASLSGLESENEALRAEHAPCGATISQLHFDLDQANRVADNRGEEINEVRLRLCKADERSERHADLLKKASDNLSRAKFAQDALEEEVEQ